MELTDVEKHRVPFGRYMLSTRKQGRGKGIKRMRKTIAASGSWRAVKQVIVDRTAKLSIAKS